MIQTTLDGVIISVRVIPRAGRSGVAGTRGDSLLVRLQAPPLDGARILSFRCSAMPVRWEFRPQLRVRMYSDENDAVAWLRQT